MTIKQLWLATVTLLAVAALSRPDAFFDVARYAVDLFTWGLVAVVEHTLVHGLGH